MKNIYHKLFLFICVASLFACADLNGGSPYGGGYNDPYRRDYDYGYQDDYYRRNQRDRYRDERKDLERDRDRLERERRELEAQREREAQRSREAARSRVPAPERCPSGFSPSERKCSQEERRRGCQDMRLPGGLGCVKR